MELVDLCLNFQGEHRQSSSKKKKTKHDSCASGFTKKSTFSQTFGQKKNRRYAEIHQILPTHCFTTIVAQISSLERAVELHLFGKC